MMNERRERVPPDFADNCKYLYDDGYTIAYIAYIMDVPKQTVYHHLRRINALHPQHKRSSNRCSRCKCNHLYHTWCMKWPSEEEQDEQLRRMQKGQVNE